jgi:hypothetical protein
MNKEEFTDAIPLANLALFVNDRLNLALGDAAGTSSSVNDTEVLSSLNVIESFLWLHVGVRVGYFPESPSRRLVYEYFPPILRAYEIIQRTKNLETWFPNPVRTALSAEFSGKAALFTFTERPVFPKSDYLVAFFQGSFLLSNGFAQNQDGKLLVGGLSLATEPMWNRAIQNSRLSNPFSKQTVPIEPDASGKRWYDDGFTVAIEYMKDVLRFLDDVRTMLRNLSDREIAIRERDALPALDRLFMEIKEIQQWRLNFGFPTPRERFLQIAREFAQPTFRETVAEEPFETAMLIYEREILELLEHWGAPKMMSAWSA